MSKTEESRAYQNECKKIIWKGYSRKDRNEVIHKVEKIINQYGDILDFKFFSDMDISLVIEIEERKITDLHKELSNYLPVDTLENSFTASKQEQIILLNITFKESTGNLEHPVPSVPG